MQDRQYVKEITKGDILLGMAYITVVVCFFIWSFCYFNAAGQKSFASEDAIVTIEQAGEVVETCSLNQEKEITTEWQGHENTIVISNGSVSITDANCPDKYCEKHAPVTGNHESIICLPAQLVVTITGGEAGGVDAVSN